jgi:hypothetical protein
VALTFYSQKKQGKDFIFDIEDFRNSLVKGEYVEVQRLDVERRKMHELIKSYLLHYGYVETLSAIEAD